MSNEEIYGIFAAAHRLFKGGVRFQEEVIDRICRNCIGPRLAKIPHFRRVTRETPVPTHETPVPTIECRERDHE
jgi:hypothetical protein